MCKCRYKLEIEYRELKEQRQILHKAKKILKKHKEKTKSLDIIIDELDIELENLEEEIYLDTDEQIKQSLELISKYANRKIRKEEQLELLEEIKDIFGRDYPTTSKSKGLSAWLKYCTLGEDVSFAYDYNKEDHWKDLVILK